MRITKGYMFTLLMLLLTICLVGCSGGSYKIIKGSIDHTQDSIEGSYSQFNGRYFNSLKLEEGTTMRINFEEHTEEGSITMQLLDMDDNVLLTLEEASENKDIKIEKTGKYQVRVSGSNHKGDFKVSWAVLSQ